MRNFQKKMYTPLVAISECSAYYVFNPYTMFGKIVANTLEIKSTRVFETGFLFFLQEHCQFTGHQGKGGDHLSSSLPLSIW